MDTSKISFLFSILWLIFMHFNTAFGQYGKIEGGSNDFGFIIGLNEYQVKEKVLNNIKHQGIIPSFGFSYEKSKEIAKHKFELYFIYNELKSRYDPDKASMIINPSINYRYARKVKSINRNFSVYLGGKTGADYHIAFFENWDESHAYWLTSYYLSFDGIFTYQKSLRSSFSMEIDIPLIAFISRPPARILYKESNPEFSWIMDKLHENLSLTSIQQHFALNMILGYTIRHSGKFKQNIFWRFSYVNNRMTYSKDLSILRHIVGVTFIF